MSKKKFLFIMIDGGGNVPPMFGLMKQLIARGHEVHVLTEPCLKEAVENQGCTFISFTDYFVKEDRKEDFFQDHNASLLKNPVFERVIFGPAETVIHQTIETAKLIDADALMIDLLLFPAVMAGEFLEIPKMIVFHMPEYMPGPNRPPGNMGIKPGSGVFVRLRDRILGKLMVSKFNENKSALNKIRAQLNLEPLRNTVDLMDMADLRIIQTLRSFDIPVEPAPENVRYSGPVLDDPDWVSEDQFKADKSKPLIVISFSSTFQNQKEILQKSMNALKNLPVKGLVTLGMAMEDEIFDVPENVTLLSSAKHSEIFPHADLVITHAGHGTVMRALANGVPLICLPNGRDQKDNALKVELKGCGIKLSRKTGSDKIKRTIELLLNDPSYRANASKIRKELDALDEMNNVLDEVEALIS